MPKRKKKNKKQEKTQAPWEKERPKFLQQKFENRLIPKQEKLAKGWRRT